MPTEQIAPAAAPRVLTVPLARLNVVDGFNPREEFDSDKQQRLRDSFRTWGILEPIKVEPHPELDGEWNIVDGHRRYFAAAEEGFTEVPIYPRVSNNGDALDIAVITAEHRVGLNVIEEAKAFKRQLAHGGTQAELGKRLAIPPRRISVSLRLLDLPDGVQGLMASGKLAASSAKTLLAITKISPAVADIVAEFIVSADLDLALLADRPSDVVSKAVQGRDVTCIMAARNVEIRDLALPADLRGRALELFGNADNDRAWISFDREDVDAADAYGCLLRFDRDASYMNGAFLCSSEFVADRVALKVEAQAARVEAQRKADADAQAKADAKKPAGPAAKAEAEIRAKVRRAAELKAMEDDRIEARGANLTLGRDAAERFHEPKITKPVAELVALAIFDRETAQLAARGLRLTQADWQTEETRFVKSANRNKTRVTYLEPREAEEALWAWFRRARNAEQMIGRVVQALIAARHADQSVLPQSKRSQYRLPGGWDPSDPTHKIGALLDRIAKPVLPPRLAVTDDQG